MSEPSQTGRQGGYYPRQSAPRTPPTKPTPPPVERIKEGALPVGESGLWRKLFGKWIA